MNPADPATLDPYRYADNNPVVFTDASGLAACYGLSAANEQSCMSAYSAGTSHKKTPSTSVQIVPVSGTPVTFTRGKGQRPPHISWDSNCHGCLKASVGDYLSAIKWKSQLTGGRIGRQDLDHATAAYKHYWDNTGSRFSLDLSDAYEEDGAIRRDIDANIAYATQAADAMIRSGAGPKFSIQSTAAQQSYPETENWQKAIGGYQAWSHADVAVSGGVASMEVTVVADDYYNFNPGWSDIATGAPDDENVRFEQIGWAQGFPQTGTVSASVSWRVGSPQVVSASNGPTADRNRSWWSEDRPDR